MAEVTVNKKDIIWSYIAQFFNVGSGLIILPLILHMLSPTEIAMNYLMLTVSSLIALLDFGFLPQFSRNITYIFSGVPDLKKEGILPTEEKINYLLLKNMIGIAKRVYTLLGLSALFLMLTLGSIYMSEVTANFTNVSHSLVIWLLFSASTFFNIYFSYYASLLSGKGQVMESKIAMVAQRSTYIILSFILLFCGFSLLGVVVANLVSPFVGRYLYHRYFYTKELSDNLSEIQTDKEELKRLFWIIWYNSKKMGIIAIAAFGITKIGLFLSGIFLSSEDIASYGLMIQLVTLLVSIAGTHYISIQPLLGSLYATKNIPRLKEQISIGLLSFYLLFALGLATIVILGPLALSLIKSNAILPKAYIIILYGIICLLETNTSFFATILVLGNKINFVTSSILTSLGIILCSYLSLKYTALGILGLVIAQGIPGCFYSYWKWTYVVCKKFHTSLPSLLWCGKSIIISKISHLL